MRRSYVQGGGQRPIPRHRVHHALDGDAAVLVVTDCDWRVRIHEHAVAVACPRCGAWLDVPDVPPWLSDALSADLSL